jgi:ABC-type bacteriocin/lantibiotic exporter with double-glycine peptidase domain
MRLNSNATIREIVTSSALSGLLDGSLVCLYLVLVFVVDLRVGLVVLLLGALRVLLLLATLRRQRELTADSLAVEAEAQGYQVQMLDGIAALKIGAAEPRALERWSNLFVDVLNANVRRARLNALVDAFLEALATASPGVVLLYGAARVLAGELTLGTMLALSALAVGFLDPLSKLVAMVAQLQMVHAYLDRIGDVLDAPREQQPGGRDLGSLQGRITVENLAFRYTPQAPFAVQDISLEILPGQFIALVGPSGAGKTTFANLLLGIYAPSLGRVSYDGVDLRTLDLHSLRRQLGVVPQLPGILGGTVRDNITLGDRSVPLARVIDAALSAEIHDEIMAMPMGYNTILAGRGASISGGQRQRLALARALLHRPAVLLLDEATSELDGLSESLIAARLAGFQATRIVIAHRLSTIRRADVILVLDQGRIVERGRHDDLLARGAAYARLVQAQLRES